MKFEMTVSQVSGLLLELKLRDFSMEPGDPLPLAVRDFWERHLTSAAKQAKKAYAIKVGEEKVIE